MAVVPYAHISTAKQGEKDLSIPDQLRQMREWCKAQGDTLRWNISNRLLCYRQQSATLSADDFDRNR